MTAHLVDQESLDALKTFLSTSKLPHQDIHPDANMFFMYNDDAGERIGSGGLELYGSCALLRSVAVAEHVRGRSYGKDIVQDLIGRARILRVTRLYLLTETAQAFFERLGFRNIGREDVPLALKASSEFSSVCPASAVCMEMAID